MFDAGGGKQNVIHLRRFARPAVNKFSAALRDNINFIARMRRLRIAAARDIELDYEGTVLEQSDRALALWPWQTLKRLAQSNSLTGIGGSHFSLALNRYYIRMEFQRQSFDAAPANALGR